jgi:hypothetical protein
VRVAPQLGLKVSLFAPKHSAVQMEANGAG